jgi:hypothetical protein
MEASDQQSRIYGAPGHSSLLFEPRGGREFRPRRRQRALGTTRSREQCPRPCTAARADLSSSQRDSPTTWSRLRSLTRARPFRSSTRTCSVQPTNRQRAPPERGTPASGPCATGGARYPALVRRARPLLTTARVGSRRKWPAPMPLLSRRSLRSVRFRAHPQTAPVYRRPASPGTRAVPPRPPGPTAVPRRPALAPRWSDHPGSPP